MSHCVVKPIADRNYRADCLQALSRCEVLRSLDLHHVSSVSVRHLFHSLQQMRNLERLIFARKSSHGNGLDWGTAYTWPPKLQNLTLYGDINERHPLFLGRFPQSLTYLAVLECPGLSTNTIYHWLRVNGRSLERLKIGDWSPKHRQDLLDDIPLFIPSVRYLQLSHRCISLFFFLNKFCGAHLELDPKMKRGRYHPLETLELICLDHVVHRKEPGPEITPDVVLFAIVKQLHNLRTFIIDERLGWWDSYELRRSLRTIYCFMEYHSQLGDENRKVKVGGYGPGYEIAPP